MWVRKTTIEVAYATPQRQQILTLEVDPGIAVREAIKQSGILNMFPEIDGEHCDFGVFGKAVKADYELIEGDRIEIYRDLIADPKEVRRQRAAKGLKTGKGGGKV